MGWAQVFLVQKHVPILSTPYVVDRTILHGWCCNSQARILKMAPSCETVFQLLFAGQLHGKLEWFFQVPEGFSEKPEEVECLLQRYINF